MTDATPSATDVRRCPACGAVRPPTAQWCLQCYAAFDPPQPAEPALGPQQPRRADVPDAPADETAAPADATDAEGTAGHDVPAADGDDLDDVDRRAEQMLAQLSVQGSSAPVGRLGALTSSRGSKVGLAIGGAVALTLVLLALMAGVGVLL